MSTAVTLKTGNIPGRAVVFGMAFATSGAKWWFWFVACRCTCGFLLYEHCSFFRNDCCSLTASLWRTSLLAFSRVNASSIWRRSDRLLSRMPTTSLSRIISFFKFTIFTVFHKVIESSDELFNGFLLTLKSGVEAWSLKDHVFRILKWPLNFPSTSTYFLQFSSEILVEVETSSASSPKQYRSVLTCVSSSSLRNPDATRNCSKRRRHLGHLSGELKLNGGRGWRDKLSEEQSFQLVTSDTMLHVLNY